MNLISDEFDRVYIAKYIEDLGISEIADSFQTTTKVIQEVV